MSKTMRARVIKAEEPATPFGGIIRANALVDKEVSIDLTETVLPPYPQTELKKLVEMSTILGRCVWAYKRNIPGFGVELNYAEEQEETEALKSEWAQVEDWIEQFNFDCSFEDVIGAAIEDRETTGNGYIEVLRDGSGQIAEGSYVDCQHIKITKLSDPVEVDAYLRNGKTVKRRKRFRRYIQEIGTTKVYFKELGDPRPMNKKTGKYEDGGSIPEADLATELWHLKVGNGVYGVPRWIGQLIHMYGARKAEELNYRYFTQARHTPMAILLHNSKLSDESELSLQEYVNSMNGVENSFKFLLLEAEGETEGILDEEIKNAKVELKSLADMLQKDALFLEYDEASRKKVQSSFGLPDLYVGRTTDFNRATAEMARQVTEEQIFEPERNSIEWVINHKMLRPNGFTNVVMNFNSPEISDTEDVVKVVDALGKLNVFAVNDLRDLGGKVLGKTLEPFEGDEYNLPPKAASPTFQDAQDPLDQQNFKTMMLEKSRFNNLMKDIRDILDDKEIGGRYP